MYTDSNLTCYAVIVFVLGLVAMIFIARLLFSQKRDNRMPIGKPYATSQKPLGRKIRQKESNFFHKSRMDKPKKANDDILDPDRFFTGRGRVTSRRERENKRLRAEEEAIEAYKRETEEAEYEKSRYRW